MSDPVTKLLIEAAEKNFTAAEKKRFREMGRELAECYETLSDYDPGKLAQQLGNAHAGVGPSGEKLDGMDTRLAAVAKISQALEESPARLAHARESERGLFAEAKPFAHRLLTAAIAQADGLLSNPPPMPVPPILSTWGIDLDLVSQFTAIIAGARQTLCADLADDYSRRGSPEIGFHRLSRAQLTTTEK